MKNHQGETNIITDVTIIIRIQTAGWFRKSRTYINTFAGQGPLLMMGVMIDDGGNDGGDGGYLVADWAHFDSDLFLLDLIAHAGVFWQGKSVSDTRRVQQNSIKPEKNKHRNYHPHQYHHRVGAYTLVLFFKRVSPAWKK